MVSTFFYLANAEVKRTIFQEESFDNLGYQYDVRHLPILFTAKGKKALGNREEVITFDIGLGPNIIKAKNFRDFSRDDGETIPNHAFLDNTNVDLAASAKVGVLFNNAMKGLLIEIAYRFLYLGRGELKPRTNAIQNTLETGNAYAHSLTLSTIFEG